MNEAAALPRLDAFAGREALTEAAARAIADRLERRLSEAPRAAFAASGGTTPAPVYRRLSKWPLEWSRIDVTLTDERFVGPASPDSNERMVRVELLKGPAADATFIPLCSAEASADAAGLAAEHGLKPLLPFALVLLGMGEDGHVASLFPGSPALAQGLDPATSRLCIGVPQGAPAPPQPRISLTLRALLDAGLILILITGDAKRRTLEAAIGGDDLPVGQVLRQSRTPVRILWSP